MTGRAIWMFPDGNSKSKMRLAEEGGLRRVGSRWDVRFESWDLNLPLPSCL